MSGHSSRIVLSVLVGTSLAVPTRLLADEPAAPAVAPGTPADQQLVEIVVMARKRAERTLDVPTSITAVGAEEIGRYATTNLESLSSQIPQLEIIHNPTGTGAVVSIRGIGTNNTGDDGVEQAVSLNIDGIPTSRGRAIQQGLFDLDNIQVLKGPQALYFGKNSPGGVIILESKGPTSQLAGYVSSGYEFTAREYRGEAAIGGPITDTLGFRLAAQGSDMMGGYVRNVSDPISAADNPVAYDHANGVSLPGAPWEWGPASKQYAGRATLAWDPSSDFKGTLKVFASHYEDNGEMSTVQLLTCPAGFPRGAITDLGALAFGQPPGVLVDPTGSCDPRRRETSLGALPGQFANNYPLANGGVPFATTDGVLASLNLAYNTGPISLTSITGYYDYRNQNFSNYDYATFVVIPAAIAATNTTWSEEFRAVSKFQGPLNFFVGGYYETFHRSYNTWAGLVRAVNADGSSYNDNTLDVQSGKTISGVGEITLTPVEGLELSGGARYTHESKSGLLSNVYVQPGIVQALGIYAPGGTVINTDFAANNVSPQATLSWHPSRDLNVFLGYHTGFKSGGISAPNFVARSATASNVVFQNEKADGVEGGVKFEGADRSWSGDVTIYHYIYKGLQVSAFDPVSNVVRITNAGKAQLDGVEPNLRYALDRNLSFHTALSYNHARYTSFNSAQCYAGQTAAQGCNLGSQQDLTGQPLPLAPKFSGTLGAVFEHDLPADYALSLTVDGRYSGRYFYTATEDPFTTQGGYFLVDASLRLKQSGHVELALIGKNLTDKYYAIFGTDRPLGIAPGSVNGVAGLPRTVELQATVNF